MSFALDIFRLDTCVSRARTRSDIGVSARVVDTRTWRRATRAHPSCVQPEHEEEWMEWVDWAQVEGQASGSSSNLAAMFDGHFVSVGF